MPFYLEKSVSEGVKLGVWEIQEESEVLLSRLVLGPGEKQLYETFRNETRSRHWLSYRVLISVLLKEAALNVHYFETGKPYLANRDGHISVSHSGDFSAVICSKKEIVGIDIEKIQDRIEKVAHKFLREDEIEALDPVNRTQHLVSLWAGKESLYKMIGDSGVDFRDHLHIEPFRVSDEGSYRAKVNHRSCKGEFLLHYRRIKDYMLVWVVGN